MIQNLKPQNPMVIVTIVRWVNKPSYVETTSNMCKLSFSPLVVITCQARLVSVQFFSTSSHGEVNSHPSPQEMKRPTSSPLPPLAQAKKAESWRFEERFDTWFWWLQHVGFSGGVCRESEWVCRRVTYVKIMYVHPQPFSRRKFHGIFNVFHWFHISICKMFAW